MEEVAFSGGPMPRSTVVPSRSFCYHLMSHPSLGSWLGDPLLHETSHSVLV